MKHTRIHIAAGAAAVAGIFLAACNGESAKPDAAPPPVAAVPGPEDVVHKVPFSSPEGQEWIKSTTSLSEVQFKGADLAWANAAGKDRRIVEAGCMDEQGSPVHCHLEVKEDIAGDYVPERILSVKKGSRAKTYDIEIRTVGENADTEFMICKDVEEVGNNDQSVHGRCKVYPVLYDYPDPEHDFCAHTRIESGKLVIYYRFTHDDCTQSSGKIHNGNGHTD